jgi:uncharacterized protein YprB with RNaseH-like and TPR domain
VPEGRFSCIWRHPVVIDEDLKLAYLDIETSNLDANFGQMHSYAIKPQGQAKVIAESIEARTLDAEKRLLEDFLKDIAPYNCWITYYGTEFDVKFLRTRCMYHGLEFPPYGTAIHVDLYYVARGRMKLSSNRLQSVAEFLGIEGKTPLRGEIWVKASLGDKEALGYILDHNIEDVRVLEKVHARLEPFMKSVMRRSI